MAFSIVAAVDEESGLGKNGTLAWRLREDMAFFKALTTAKQPYIATKKFGLDLQDLDFSPTSYSLNPFTNSGEALNTVLIGRKTWDSIPSAYAPLGKRQNVVLTRDSNLQNNYKTREQSNSDMYYCSDLETALEQSKHSPHVYLIGGGSLYKQAIVHPECRWLFLTQLQGNFGCDTFFPDIPKAFKQVKESCLRKEGEIEFKYTLWKKE